MPTAPLQTFIIYARADEAHKNELLRHLKGTLIASGALRVWQDGNLLPGEDWEKSIKQNLKQSALVLVLVSSDSLGSDFINTEELRMALEQRAEGRSTVVPIILRSCLWMSHPILRGLQGLPKNMKPVKSYADADEAWTEVLEGLERILLGIREKSETLEPPIPATPPPTVMDLAEEAAWKMAVRLNSKAAYQHYLEEFPNGANADTARRRTDPSISKAKTFNSTDLASVKREEVDDFKEIAGINSKIRNLLYRNGIRTYYHLSNITIERLEEILANAGPEFVRQDVETWPAQAHLAAQNQWNALRYLQEFLPYKEDKGAFSDE